MRPILPAAIIAACSLAACGKAPAPAPAAQKPEKSAAEQQAMVASLPAPFNAGDPAEGKKVFGLCRSCHSIAQGGPNLTGPHLYGVFGRPAASVADYSYSDALKAAGGNWTPERLDHWLANPRTALPGTKMTFAGIKDPKQRANLIAYLRTQADS